ncbi:hypothetical protein HDU87_005574 [Geranomyces variabilis]|uniref:Uncharacterized protein n=1 Tax=Geranomyces variabilis TaxID=109894 RepID=A0AAD5XL19_9FUNG|nr:hypothetical protein HDU87_005574 [Geranomyces variabilis]
MASSSASELGRQASIGSADALVAADYPSSVTKEDQARMKFIFRTYEQNPEQGGRILFLNTAVEPSVMSDFLMRVTANGRDQAQRNTARRFFQAYWDTVAADADAPARKKRRMIAKSGSEWTADALEYFNIAFTNVASDQIAPGRNLPPSLHDFVSKNSFITNNILLGKESTTARTRFFGLMRAMTMNENSSVVDVMMYLLSTVLPEEFVVKTRWRTPLRMAGSTKTEAAADVIVWQEIPNTPRYRIGVVVVEVCMHACEEAAKEQTLTQSSQDKNYSSQFSEKTEAQMVAAGIATAQHADWNFEQTMFLLQVSQRGSVTVYRTQFSKALIDDVANGNRRGTPHVIFRHTPSDSTDNRGYLLENPADRRALLQLIYSIGVYLSENPPS